MDSPDRSAATTVGHWCALVCGQSNGWDRTILGIVVYAGDGTLAYSRWAGIEKAIRRGDWKADWFTPEFNPPVTWAEMEKKLGSTGNAMSTIRWDAGFATTDWSAKTGEALYRMVEA